MVSKTISIDRLALLVAGSMLLAAPTIKDYLPDSTRETHVEAASINPDVSTMNYLIWGLINPAEREKLEKNKSIDDVLSDEGVTNKFEIRAYKDILSARKELDKISSQMEHVDTSLLMGIIMQEVRGMKYKEGNSGDSGQMQLTFDGAYSFFWKAYEFSIGDNKDPYWSNIDTRYSKQLKSIFSEWEKNNILVKGDKNKTWENLKDNFKKGFNLNVFMGCLYADFEIHQHDDERTGLAYYNEGNNFGSDKAQNYATGVIKYKQIFRAALKATG